MLCVGESRGSKEIRSYTSNGASGSRVNRRSPSTEMESAAGNRSRGRRNFVLLSHPTWGGSDALNSLSGVHQAGHMPFWDAVIVSVALSLEMMHTL
jgi:hypothetical protein